MVIIIERVVLMCLMLLILWQSGKALRKSNSLLSAASITAILAFTLNEGLRFGRGYDYSWYWQMYDFIGNGVDVNHEIVFTSICRVLNFFNLPFQSLILVSSFVFVLAAILLVRNMKEITSIVLPLFLYFPLLSFENMVRWYFAYSFFIIGLSFYLKEDRKTSLYIIFNIIACSIHYAFIPIPFIVFFICNYRKPLLHPLLSLSLFYAIYFFFETEFMLRFVSYIDIIAAYSPIFSSYANNAEYWLTGGFGGNKVSGVIGIGEMCYYSILVILGYLIIKRYNKQSYIISYNLFLIGLLGNPIGHKIELLDRYIQVFIYFHPIVLSYILYYYYIRKKMKVRYSVLIISAIVFIYNGSRNIIRPFKESPRQSLYVWNKGNEDANSMTMMWINESYKQSVKKNR